MDYGNVEFRNSTRLRVWESDILKLGGFRTSDFPHRDVFIGEDPKFTNADAHSVRTPELRNPRMVKFAISGIREFRKYTTTWFRNYGSLSVGYSVVVGSRARMREFPNSLILELRTPSSGVLVFCNSRILQFSNSGLLVFWGPGGSGILGFLYFATPSNSGYQTPRIMGPAPLKFGRNARPHRQIVPDVIGDLRSPRRRWRRLKNSQLTLGGVIFPRLSYTMPLSEKGQKVAICGQIFRACGRNTTIRTLTSSC